MKKALIFILTLAMLVAPVSLVASSNNLFSISAYAVSYVGKCGERVSWKYNISSGELTISGSGAMSDYTGVEQTPWFKYADSLTSVVVENGVGAIGNNAFYRYLKLARVSIAPSVRSIGENAFYGCTNLMSLKIEKQSRLRSILPYAFAYCRNMSDINFPGNLESIGEYAFYCCYGLTKVNLKSSLSEIGKNAFASCSNLKKIRIENYNCDIYDSNETIYRNTVIQSFDNSTAKAYADNYMRKFKKIKNIVLIGEVEVNLAYTSKTYTGQKLKPTVKIKGLKAGRDFTVDYYDNKNPGIATVTVNGTGGKAVGTSTLNFKILPATPLKITVSKKTKRSITLTWKDVKGATEYIVSRKINGKWKKVATVTSNTAKIDGLKPGKGYIFKVRAATVVGDETCYGSFSAPFTFKTKSKKS